MARRTDSRPISVYMERDMIKEVEENHLKGGDSMSWWVRMACWEKLKREGSLEYLELQLEKAMVEVDELRARIGVLKEEEKKQLTLVQATQRAQYRQ
jgi:hypothetical protein